MDQEAQAAKTTREIISACCLAGLLANPSVTNAETTIHENNHNAVVDRAVRAADRLIERLKRKP